MFTLSGYIIAAAFLLDLVLADPDFSVHPIRLMGRAIEKGELFCRSRWGDTVWSGLWCALALIVGTWLVATAMIALARLISPLAGGLLQLILLYFCLSLQGLRKSAQEIHGLLQASDLEQARQRLAMIVGRQVAELDETGVSRATVETVAENLVDGVLSPLFFALLGGAPLALAYKMVNTLDSMIGYKNERYQRFGKAAARIDDVANYLPARLAVPIIAAAAGLFFKSGRRALRTALQQGKNHASPNAGYPEAAFAGALSLTLGGPNYYHGRRVDKPYIGPGLGPVRPEDIRSAVRLLTASATGGVLLAMLLTGLG